MLCTKYVYIILGRRGYVILPFIIETLETQALLLSMGNLDFFWAERDPGLETHIKIVNVDIIRFCPFLSSGMKNCLVLDCG